MTESLLATEANPNPEGQATPPAEGSEPEARQPAAKTPAEGEGQPPADPDTKPTGEETGEASEQPEVPGAPETYEFTAPKGMPEGHELDAAVLDTYAEVARELNLPQESAQKVLDRVMPKLYERAVEQQQAQHEAWIAETRKHAELIKPADANDKRSQDEILASNLHVAKQAIAKFGGDGFAKLMEGPIGSHPDNVAAWVRVGRALQPDGFVAGGRTGTPQSFAPDDRAGMAKVLYPNSPD